MEIRKHYRYWAVFDDKENLVCITVYKKGAVEVVKRLTETKTEQEKEEVTHESNANHKNHSVHP